MNYLRSIIYPGIPSLPDVLSADDRRYGRSQYFLDVIDESRRVGSSLVVQILAGGIAGLSGAGIGGGLLKLLSAMELRGLDMYRAYFQIIVLILLAIYLVSSRRNGQVERKALINDPGYDTGLSGKRHLGTALRAVSALVYTASPDGAAGRFSPQAMTFADSQEDVSK